MKFPAVFTRYIDWFLWGMGIAVVLAWIFPEAGGHGGWMHPELLTKCGVALIFFLHGALLSFDAIKQGAVQWRLHLIIQAVTFIVFPCIGWLVMRAPLAASWDELKIGFFFLCALPSTVSSSVAMTAAARGNVPLAIFNATLSSLLGIFLTPIWIGVIVPDASAMPFMDVLLDLFYWLVLPLVIGHLMRPLIGAVLQRHKQIVNKVDRVTILLLVYTSFCDSVQWGVWSKFQWPMLVGIMIAVTLLFFIVFWISRSLCNMMNVEKQDRIAVIFCASKKTLAQGVPMAQLIFAGNPALGIILVPIMLYHPIQLFICGILASRWSEKELKSAY